MAAKSTPEPKQPTMPSTLGIPWDKALHAGVGYISADGTRKLEDFMGIRDRYSIAPIMVAALLASAKEGIDSETPGNKWDWSDWLATMGGASANYTFDLPNLIKRNKQDYGVVKNNNLTFMPEDKRPNLVDVKQDMSGVAEKLMKLLEKEGGITNAKE